MSATFATSFGLAPTTVSGARIAGDVTFHHFRADLAGALYAQSEVEIRGNGAGAVFDLWIAEASGAYELATDRLRVLPTAGVQLARIGGDARAAAVNRKVADLVLVPFAGVQASWEIVPPFALYVVGDAGLTVGRSRFVIEGYGPVHEAAAVAGRLGAGVRITIF
jgi:hypothetical protein